MAQTLARLPEAAGLSDGQIAEHCGVHRDTVREWRQKLAPPLAESASQPAKRTGRDGRTINTGNIGRGKRPACRAVVTMRESRARRPGRAVKAALPASADLLRK